MSIQKLHREAIRKAKLASDCLENGDNENYTLFIFEAYELEKQAAELLFDKTEAEPTRAVLYRSAASLAYKCGKYHESIDLIIKGLQGNPFTEIRIELLELLKSVSDINIEQNSIRRFESAYLESLRGNSVNLKLEETSPKYSGAFSIPNVTEFLKNFQESYKNYAEIQFRKAVPETNFKNYDQLLNKFKSQAILLGADTKFSSFGISLSADKSIMDTLKVYTDEYKIMKRYLFSDFKEDVLYPNYEDIEFQNRIKRKFTDLERYKIFGSIDKSISKNKNYKISITDSKFYEKLKEFKPLNDVVKDILVPKIDLNEMADVDEEVSLIKKIEQTKGKKTTLIESVNITYYETDVSIKELKYLDKGIYFNSPYTYKLIFESNSFKIDDNHYKIFLTDRDYHNVISNYSKVFISNYINLLNNQTELSIDEKELLDFIESSTIRDW